MTNLTANVVHETKPRGRRAVVVKNAEPLYAGALVGVADADGLLSNWDNLATTRFLGLLLENVTGNTSASPPVTGRVDTSGKCLVGVAVAGTPTQAKLEEPVYCADGNPAGLTMNATTSPAIGKLVRFGTASDCDVQLYTPEEFAASQI